MRKEQFLCYITVEDWLKKSEAKAKYAFYACYGYMPNGKKVITVFAHSDKPDKNGIIGFNALDKNDKILLFKWDDIIKVLKNWAKSHHLSLVNKQGVKYDIYFHGCCDGYKKEVIEDGFIARPMSNIKAPTITSVRDSHITRVRHSDGSVTLESMTELWCSY